MERVTIKNVAREAGVSISAVSRVLTPGGSASPETRERVKEAAKKLGYRPSLLARGLVSNKTSLVTLVGGSLSDPFDAMLVENLSEALGKRGTRLLLTSTISQSADENGLLQALDYQSDGVIVSAGTVSLEDSAFCVKAGLPVILAGRILEADGVDCVLADNQDSGRQAAELFLRTGCQCPAYLGLGGATFSDRERFEGFESALSLAGVAVAEHGVEERDHAAVASGATRLLCSNTRPDAIFCSNDGIAIAVIEAARGLGIAIPKDLSIIGFNNNQMAAWRSFQLTTFDYPTSLLVENVVSLLDNRLEDRERPTEIRRIPTELVVRATTRGAAGGG